MQPLLPFRLLEYRSTLRKHGQTFWIKNYKLHNWWNKCKLIINFIQIIKDCLLNFQKVVLTVCSQPRKQTCLKLHPCSRRLSFPFYKLLWTIWGFFMKEVESETVHKNRVTLSSRKGTVSHRLCPLIFINKRLDRWQSQNLAKLSKTLTNRMYTQHIVWRSLILHTVL